MIVLFSVCLPLLLRTDTRTWEGVPLRSCAGALSRKRACAFLSFMACACSIRPLVYPTALLLCFNMLQIIKLLMCRKIFSMQVNNLALELEEFRNGLGHFSSQVEFHRGYEAMKELLQAFLNEAEEKEQLQTALEGLEAHLREHRPFFPARNTLQEMMQSALRAEHLTRKAFLTHEQSVVVSPAFLTSPEKRRWWVEASASSGKTFVLVTLAVMSVLKALHAGSSPQRTLIVCHSELLREDISRCVS